MSTIHRNLFSVFLFLLAIPLAGATLAGESDGDGPAFTDQQVTFKNGDVSLQGTLLTPKKTGPVPVIVYLHGSGPMTREGFRPYAEKFARLGIAGLFYDKRGTGDSGGSWTSASLDDLAGDALAAIAYLNSQKQFKASRIGFWGISQAGWIAPYAAARSDDVGFMMVISGGGATPRESELYSYQKEFEKAGLSDEQQQQGFAALDTWFDYLGARAERAQLQASLDSLRGGPLKPLAEQLDRVTPSEKNRANWSWVADYDPAEDIAKISGPVLLLFGTEDHQQPSGVAMKKWREGLHAAGNQRVTLVEFPGAGHGIRVGSAHSHEGRAPFADGYEDVQIGWLWRHLIDEKE